MEQVVKMERNHQLKHFATLFITHNQLSHSVLTYEKGRAVTCVRVNSSALGQAQSLDGYLLTV